MLEAVLLPALMALRPAERMVAWNIGYVDDALAVVLAYLHLVPARDPARFLAFHSGVPPASRPIEWGVGDLRGVPKEPWIERAPGPRRRWRPHRQALESVLLGQPSGLVDLLILGSAGEGTGSAVDQVRQGGHVLMVEPAQADERSGPDRLSRPDWKAVDPGRHLLRRVTPPARRDVCSPSSFASAPTLALHQEQADLIQAYTGLARSVARRFSYRGERADDLEQVALLALVKAAGRYDPERGRPFAAFAAVSITGELKRHFRDKVWSVRVPRSVQEMHLAIRSARDELTSTQGRSPTIGQIADYLHESEEAVLAAMEAATNAWATSLDAPSTVGDGDGAYVPVEETGFDRALDRRVLMQTVADLSPTERLILKRVFFDGLSQRQVAEELDVSQMQISRLTTKALSKMKKSFHAA